MCLNSCQRWRELEAAALQKQEGMCCSHFEHSVCRSKSNQKPFTELCRGGPLCRGTFSVLLTVFFSCLAFFFSFFFLLCHTCLGRFAPTCAHFAWTLQENGSETFRGSYCASMLMELDLFYILSNNWFVKFLLFLDELDANFFRLLDLHHWTTTTAAACSQWILTLYSY